MSLVGATSFRVKRDDGMSDPGLPLPSTSRQPELESWKDIAAYLHTSVRTVQRWEEQNGLPIHRIMREKRAAIYAHPHELDEWLARRTVPPAKPDAPPAPGPAPDATPAPRRTLWTASLALLAVVIAFAWARSNPNFDPVIHTRRLTSSPGFELHPAQSPDGAWVAYARSFRGQNSITIQSTTTPETVQIGQDPALAYSPQWSPDGNSLLFLRRKSDQISELLRYDWKRRTGPTLIAEVLGQNWFDAGVHAYPAVQWTPDGQDALLLDRDPVTRSYRILRLNLDSLERLPVFESPPGASMHGFALSRDGSQLAVVIRSRGPFEVHTVPLDRRLRSTDPPIPVLADGSSTEAPAWSPQGDLLFIRSQKELWRKQPQSPPHRLPVVGEWPDYSVSVAASGELLWSHLRMDTAIWLYDLARQQPVKPLCDSTALEINARISPDGKQLLFVSARDGNSNLWLCDLATDTARQITRIRSGAVNGVRWSPDGQTIAYSVDQVDRSEIRVVRRDGAPVSTVAEGGGHRSYPVWSPDGSRVYFLLHGTELTKLQSARLDGSDLRLEIEMARLSEFDVRRDGRLWLLRAGKLFLADHPAAEQRTVAENVAALVGRAPDGLGVYLVRRTNPGITSNYTLAILEDGRPERQLAGAVPEGMGYAIGPPGFALTVRNSDANSDIFRGVFSSPEP